MGFFVPSALALLIGSIVMWQINRGKSKKDQNANADTADISTSVASDIDEKDDLQQIKGIGPIYAKRLHEAGIHTFAQLANLTPEQLSKIVAPGRTENLVNSQEWIIQADGISS